MVSTLVGAGGTKATPRQRILPMFRIKNFILVVCVNAFVTILRMCAITEGRTMCCIVLFPIEETYNFSRKYGLKTHLAVFQRFSKSILIL